MAQAPARNVPIRARPVVIGSILGFRVLVFEGLVKVAVPGDHDCSMAA